MNKMTPWALAGLRGFLYALRKEIFMDSLDKRKVEMTIEVKCIGLDEALEKTSKLVELLKEVEEYERQIALLRSSKA